MCRKQEILTEAHERLKVAKCGLQMLVSGIGEGRMGLRNVAVFGRMVTFATNNLRSQLAGFEKWDAEAKKRHFDNEACRYMVELRNVIEKQARTPTSVSAHIRSFNTDDVNKFERPPGASSFFIGDQNGGTGWMIVDSEGNETPYYVALPDDIGSVWLTLPENDWRSAAEVAGIYITSLESYLTELQSFVSSN